MQTNLARTGYTADEVPGGGSPTAQAAAADAALARGMGMRGVAGRFGVSASALQRHNARHIRPAIVAAVRQYEGLRITGLADRLATLADVAEATRTAAMRTGDAAIVLRSVAEERGVIGDLLRVLGHDAESVRAELAEAEALADAVAESARRDPAIGHAVIAELDQAGSIAASDLAAALRTYLTRASLAAIPVARD